VGHCVRESLQIPKGQRYELCRSVHAEANAIISAARRDMIGSTLYLVGKESDTGNYVESANSCAMCKKLVINAGIEKVVIRDDATAYRVIHVCDWVYYDESLENHFGY
jgi:dCMP deaminase